MTQPTKPRDPASGAAFVEIPLLAPFDAWLMPIEEAPDEVFAARLMGEGIALDPLEGLVRAPFAGEVVTVAPSGHAVTLRHESGAECLIHVGIDTVELKGAGFSPLVANGARVAAGDDLLLFDLDRVARSATSVITPLVALGDNCALRATPGRRVPAGEPIGAILMSAPSPDVSAQPPATGRTRRLRVPLANGLHARPSARIGAVLAPYAAELRIGRGERGGNARSVTALLKLGIRHGDEIWLEAKGPAAEEALQAVAALIESGMGEGAPLPSEARTDDDPARTTACEFGNAQTDSAGLAADHIEGVRASPGGALGRAARLSVQDLAVEAFAADAGHETASLDTAIAALDATLAAWQGQGEIAEAHRAIVTDPELRSAAGQSITAGMSAAAAWRTATRAEVADLQATGIDLLAERAADLIDVERQLVSLLLGSAAPEITLPENAIVIADELLPSEFARIADFSPAGIVTARGGATSHVAILAASRGIPMLVSCGPRVLEIVEGTRLIIGQDRSRLRIAPGEAEIALFKAEAEAAREAAEADRALAAQICFTADGERIEVFANCGSQGDAEAARRNGAEGCGLLRTEFLFLDRAQAPSLDEQRAVYARFAEAFAGLPVIVRTLDAGSDKPLAYLHQAQEPNPALGTRGIRLSLAKPTLLREQFAAIIEGLPADQRRIMLPMVADLGELRAASSLLRETEKALGVEQPTPLGVMVETPAAALLADQLAREADFLSIGSNDLTQYALAADRQNPALAAAADALHPAVLRLIKAAADGAHRHGRWIGVCGSLASDPDATALLIGIGVDELSVTPPQIPAIKARVRRVNLPDCRSLAARALDQVSAADVRRLIGETGDAHAI